MTSRFSTSASRAQHTPKVCISKTAEANNAEVPTWQRALITIDLPAERNPSGIPIYLVEWLTRDSELTSWSGDWVIDQQLRVTFFGQAQFSGQLSDTLTIVQPVAGGPSFPIASFSASGTAAMWSHSIYGGRSALIAGDQSQAGWLGLRFDGQAPIII